jgi:predicted small integral membrane protein
MRFSCFFFPVSLYDLPYFEQCEKLSKMHLLLSTPCFFAIIHTSLASITCIKVGATATASWTNGVSKACTWTGTVGSNFVTIASGSEYFPLPWLGDESWPAYSFLVIPVMVVVGPAARELR